MRKIILLACTAAILPVQANAAEKFVATNFYVTNTKASSIDDNSGYWVVTFEGISKVSAGPIDTMAVTCDGSGFWNAKGTSGQGICVHGVGEDTFTLRWEAEPGAGENKWQILAGKGKYLNITGQGIVTTQKLPGNRRISTLQGEVELTE